MRRQTPSRYKYPNFRAKADMKPLFRRDGPAGKDCKTHTECGAGWQCAHARCEKLGQGKKMGCGKGMARCRSGYTCEATHNGPTPQIQVPCKNRLTPLSEPIPSVLHTINP
jgi:hypothetical protein